MIEQDEPKDLAAAVADAALNGEGEVAQGYRRSVRRLGHVFAEGRGTQDALQGQEDVPAQVGRFVKTLARDAREADVSDLLDAGLSEDGAMEVAVNAAIGVGWARLENGLRAIEESNS